MKRHAFDPVSFFFGLAFTALAAWVLVADGTRDLLDARWLFPLLLIIGGLALIASLFSRSNAAATTDVGSSFAPEVTDPELEAAKEELPPDPFGETR